MIDLIIFAVLCIAVLCIAVIWIGSIPGIIMERKRIRKLDKIYTLLRRAASTDK